MEAIPYVLPKIIAAKEELLKNKWFSSIEIRVVDDASEDSSRELLKSYPEIMLVANSERSGYGASIKMGIQSSSSEYIAFMDMDDTYDPHDFISMAAKKDRDFVVGVRKESSGMPVIRRCGNEFFRQVIYFCYGKMLLDPCSGMWICKRSLMVPLLKVLPNGLHFSLKLSLVLLSMSKKPYEIPIEYAQRKGFSKLDVFEDGFRFLFAILRYRFESFFRPELEKTLTKYRA